MPTPVGRGDVQALIDDGAAIVDVLAPDEYARAHLPGAVNVPAALITRGSTRRFDRSRPIIVYGYDLQCDLSPRSARLLERFGFDVVHDYEAGKADWLAYGLPVEGDRVPVAADVLEPTLCTLPDDTADLVLARMDEEAVDVAAVVDDGDIVLGLLTRASLLRGPGDTAADRVMTPSPTTYRPDVPVAELALRLERAGEREALITTSSGRLLGRITPSGLSRPETGEQPVLARA
ncbi:MAG TPA: rhodanese-like domain-containing protein [Acidimicrobiales bacterium]|nr:rhodanese-like domain-containing protein [Acidimicrobiales bacterium]